MKYFILILSTLTMFLYQYTLAKVPAIDIWTTLNGFIEALLYSFIFYFMVVFIPQKRRANHIKKVTLMAYEDFKREIISHLAQLSEQYTGNVEHLFEPPIFKQNFPQKKWYQVANSLYDNQQFMNEWQLKSRFLKDEIMFLLNTVEHTDEQAFTSLKILCWNLQELESINLTEDYDSQKRLMRFFWEIFAGWSSISGYSNHDYIKKTITHL